MQYLKQSTAVTLKIGPFVDDTDGNTAETGLTIAQADVRLSKNGANIAQKTEATSCTHDELGIYGCPVDATDTATLGRLQLWVHESGALPVWHEYMVLPANVHDSMFSTDKLEVDILQMGGVAQSATDLKDFADTGYDPTAHRTQALIKATDDIDLSTTQKTSVNTEVDSALNTAIPGSPVADSINERVKAIDIKLPSSTYLRGTADADGGLCTADKSDINAEADTALSDINLDHLCKTATVAADMTAEVADNTILSRMLASGDTSVFDPATDSLQDIRDKLTDIETDTGTTLDTLIKDIPTVAEFEARSILSADYVVVGDTIAGVTAVTNDVGMTQAGADKVWGTAARALTDKAEFTLSTAGITAIWEKNISAYSGAGYAGTYLKTLYDDWINAGRLDAILDTIAADVVNIDGDAMRGTDSAALASVCTEGRLGELDAANIPTDVDAILADTGTDGVVIASGSKTGYALSAAGVDAILDEVVEGTTTFRQMMKIFMAALAGKSAGGGTVTLTFRDVADGKDRITATVDASGNRTAMVLDGA